MARVIVARALQAFFSLLMVTLIVFVAVRLTGDPLAVLLPEDASRERYQETARALGLDQPLPIQYATFLSQTIQGDFGTSHRTRGPVIDLILGRIPATLELSLVALFLAFVVSVPMGIYAGYWRGGWLDFVARFISVIGQSVPQFWLGLLLILCFAVWLGLLPAGGKGGIEHVVLPAVTLALAVSAGITRLMRSTMIEELERDYVKFARSKGISETQVLWKHALRNAAMPVLTLAGLISARLLTGSVVVEVVFAWPGLGRLIVDSITSRDFPVVQAGVLLLSAIYIALNFMVDVLYLYLNPRLHA